MRFDREEYILSQSPIKDDLLKLFNCKDHCLIMDIGACEGEESIRYSRLFPNASIYCFEPLPKNQKKIIENLKKYNVNNVRLIEVALSDEEGGCEFYVSSGHPEQEDKNLNWDFGNKSSSLLPPDKHLDRVPWLKFEEKIKVPTRTLNSFLLKHKIQEVDFMHMDVQGAELKVLKGAGKHIENIKAIWLEVADVSLYKGQATRNMIESFMKENNFYLAKSLVEGEVGDQMYLNKKYFKTFSFLFYTKHFRTK